MPRGVVAISSGKLQGEYVPVKKVWTFTGVPYAQPPTGERRFRRPVPAEPWSGVLPCTSSEGRKSVSVQDAKAGARPPLASGLRPCEVSEDCLHLNVWVPTAVLEKPNSTVAGVQNEQQQGAPVLVIVHGGGFLTGSCHDPAIDGTQYAQMGLVVVAPNYRLGLLGFVSVEGGDANVGLWDVARSLEWTRAEIGRFGGDPENITLCGVEAGADAALYLLASPSFGNKHFAKVILQSPTLPVPVTREQGLELADESCAILGVQGGGSPWETLRGLQNVPVSTFLRAATQARYCLTPPVPGRVLRTNPIPDGNLRFSKAGLVILPNAVQGLQNVSVVIDGVLVKANPLQSIAEGAARGMCMVIGSLKNACQYFETGGLGTNHQCAGVRMLESGDARHRIAHELKGAWEPCEQVASESTRESKHQNEPPNTWDAALLNTADAEESPEDTSDDSDVSLENSSEASSSRVEDGGVVDDETPAPEAVPSMQRSPLDMDSLSTVAEAIWETYEQASASEPMLNTVSLVQQSWDYFASDLRHSVVAKLLCDAALTPPPLLNLPTRVYWYQFNGFGDHLSLLEHELELTHGSMPTIRGKQHVREQWMGAWAQFASTSTLPTSGWCEYSPMTAVITLCDGLDGILMRPSARHRALAYSADLIAEMFGIL